MNEGLRRCPTSYALKLDSDDVASPDLVSRYIAHLAQHGAVDVLGCQFTTFGMSSYTTAHAGLITRHCVAHSRGYWFANHTGVLMNRDSVLAVGGVLLAQAYRRGLRSLDPDDARRVHSLPQS
jgi:hypothetical protein